MKGAPLVMVEMLSSSQPPVTVLPSGWSRADIFPMKILRQAQGEGVGDVEGGGPFLRMSVKGILRGGLRNSAGAAGDKSPHHGTGFIQRLGPRIAGLDAGTAVGHRSLQRSLQRVVGRVGCTGDHVLGAETSRNVPRGIELGVWSKGGPRAGIAIEEAHPW